MIQYQLFMQLPHFRKKVRHPWNKQWKNCESVDAYLADLKRLAHFASIDGENEEIIKLSFVMGLPGIVTRHLIE